MLERFFSQFTLIQVVVTNDFCAVRAVGWVGVEAKLIA